MRGIGRGLKWGIKRGAFCLLLAPGAVYSQDYQGDAETFTTLGERFRHYVHRTYTSPERLAFLVADTGIGHILNDPVQWGRHPESFGLRLASNYGSRVVANTIEFGLGAVLQEDTRYRSQGLHGLRKRIRSATVAAFTARGPDGKTKAAFSRFGATAGVVLISSTWHPCRASASGLAQAVGFGVLGKIPDNLLAEFSPDMRSVGREAFRAIFRR